MKPCRIVLYGWPHSSHLQRWAIGLSERGFTVRVIGLGGEPIRSVDTITWPHRGPRSYLLRRAAARRLTRAFNPELIHCHYASSFGLWTLGPKPAPTVVSVWGSDVTAFPSNPLKRFLIKQVLRKADKVTATSAYLRERLAALTPEVAGATAIVPFGVDIPETTRPLPATGEFRMCALKRHKQVYGLDLLIKAAALVARDLPAVHLSLPGDGPETDRLKALVKELRIEHIVSFHGQLPTDRIADFVSDHHVVVIPSREESFGVAALEAGACGRPVVASRLGGLVESVRDGYSGLLIEPENVEALAQTLVSLARDRERIAKLGANGRRLVEEEYGLDVSLDKMISVYEKVLYG
ncbi:glycosyltransferase [candidate division GN15 bacterium]|nr:glycosyltransferase [candidate division GN15 bacterium]